MSSQHIPPYHTEYTALAHGSGWLDARDRGRLRLDGPDAVRFLHALVSHDVEALKPGEGVYATWLTPQGRMIADLRIHRLDDGLLIDVAPGTAAALAQRLDLLIFTEQVRITDVTEAIAQIVVAGGGAPAALAGTFGISASELTALPVRAHVAAGEILIARADEIDLPNFEVFVPAPDHDGVVARLREAGVVAIPGQLMEALRIEAGRPRFGQDMTQETIPLEAGLLDRAISQTKGCYVGQEVIIRVLHRGGGRVARRLVRLEFDAAWPAPLPEPGTPIAVEGREAGRVTSAAWSPQTGHIVALGYVHRDQAEPAQAVSVGSGTARVIALAG